MAHEKDLRGMRAKAQALKPTLQIGKEGMTPKVFEELARQIRSKGMVKVRLNPSCRIDTSAAASELAKASSATVVDVRGRTVVLYMTRCCEKKAD